MGTRTAVALADVGDIRIVTPMVELLTGIGGVVIPDVATWVVLVGRIGVVDEGWAPFPAQVLWPVAQV